MKEKLARDDDDEMKVKRKIERKVGLCICIGNFCWFHSYRLFIDHDLRLKISQWKFRLCCGLRNKQYSSEAVHIVCEWKMWRESEVSAHS